MKMRIISIFKDLERETNTADKEEWLTRDVASTKAISEAGTLWYFISHDFLISCWPH